jgi:hypothetical protein
MKAGKTDSTHTPLAGALLEGLLIRVKQRLTDNKIKSIYLETQESHPQSSAVLKVQAPGLLRLYLQTQLNLLLA